MTQHGIFQARKGGCKTRCQMLDRAPTPIWLVALTFNATDGSIKSKIIGRIDYAHSKTVYLTTPTAM